jgi:predicted ester cyclase
MPVLAPPNPPSRLPARSSPKNTPRSFAGIAATGKRVSADVMLFYRLDGGRIVKHWMVLEMMGLMGSGTAK